MSYSFAANVNGATIEVWEWISSFILHFVIIYPCWD